MGCSFAKEIWLALYGEKSARNLTSKKEAMSKTKGGRAESRPECLLKIDEAKAKQDENQLSMFMGTMNC